MALQGGEIVEAPRLEHVHDVDTSQNHHRMTVLPNLPVSLVVDVRCRDQYAELAVSQSGDEAARLAHADTIG